MTWQYWYTACSLYCCLLEGPGLQGISQKHYNLWTQYSILARTTRIVCIGQIWRVTPLLLWCILVHTGILEVAWHKYVIG